jgi:hypothetical protein
MSGLKGSMHCYERLRTVDHLSGGHGGAYHSCTGRMQVNNFFDAFVTFEF